MIGSHKCPRRGCGAQVPDRLFCCQADWNALSSGAQHAIYKTARQNLLNPARRAAIERAKGEWNAGLEERKP